MNSKSRIYDPLTKPESAENALIPGPPDGGDHALEQCDDEKPPPFPTEALPPVAAALVREAAEAALVPESLTGAVALAVGAAAIGSGLEVRSGGKRRTRGNLFLLPVAESGTGKDAAFDAVAYPLRERQNELAKEWTDEIRPELAADLMEAEDQVKAARSELKKEKDALACGQCKEDLKAAQKRLKEAEDAIKREPCLYIGEATREALVLHLSTQAGEAGAVLAPESRGALGVLAGRYNSGKFTDEDIYCAGFSGGPHRERRVGRESVNLERPCLTVLFMLQPDKAAELFGDEAMRESGLLPRFLCFDSKAVPEDLPETPAKVSDETEKSWRDLVRLLVETFRLPEGPPKIVDIEPEALAALRDFDNETRRRRRPGGDLADVAIFTARWAEHAWRLSVVLHALRHGAEAGEAPLCLETARSGITLARWFAWRQLDMLKRGRMERRRRKAEELRALVVKAGGEATTRDLSRRHGWKQTEVKALAKRFPHLLAVETRKPDGAGRPSGIVVACKSHP